MGNSPGRRASGFALVALLCAVVCAWQCLPSTGAITPTWSVGEPFGKFPFKTDHPRLKPTSCGVDVPCPHNNFHPTVFSITSNLSLKRFHPSNFIPFPTTPWESPTRSNLCRSSRRSNDHQEGFGGSQMDVIPFRWTPKKFKPRIEWCRNPTFG